MLKEKLLEQKRKQNGGNDPRLPINVSALTIAKTSASQASRKMHQNMSKTLNDNFAKSQSTEPLLDKQLKDKLSYDWKQIYRKLNADDVDNKGTVTMRKFQKALHQTNTFLSKQELEKIQTHYGRKFGKFAKAAGTERAGAISQRNLGEERQTAIVDYD